MSNSAATQPDARVAVMLARYKAGERMQQIADSYGISRQRVHQLLAPTGVKRNEGGIHKHAERRLERAEKILEDNSIRLRGMGLNEWRATKSFKTESGLPATYAFHRQRQNARNRGIEWDMSFAEWWGVWQESGKWDQRGKGADKFCLSAIDPAKGFRLGNVDVIAFSELIRQMRAAEKAEGIGIYAKRA